MFCSWLEERKQKESIEFQKILSPLALDDCELAGFSSLNDLNLSSDELFFEGFHTDSVL